MQKTGPLATEKRLQHKLVEIGQQEQELCDIY